MAAVELQDVSKTFRQAGGREVHAVRHLDLSVADGEFVVLVGPSGCGKTSTLRMVAGLEEVTHGSIRIGGQCVNGVSPKDRDVAMVFQNYALFPHLTVFENMAFGLKLRRMSRAEIQERVSQAALILGLEDLLGRKPAALSGGQRQRVAVGRAMVRRPQVFLFDEPLSNLDARLRVQLRMELAGLHRRLGATMIYVTHDQVEAMTLGDRIAVMKDGAIQQVATPSEVYENPANQFVAGFMGSPPMNFLKGILAGEGEGLVFEEELGGDGQGRPWRIPLPPEHPATSRLRRGQVVVLGLRPESLGRVGEGEGLPAELQWVETLGAEWHLHVATAGHELVMRDREAPGGDLPCRVGVGVDVSRACFFDPATGARL